LIIDFHITVFQESLQIHLYSDPSSTVACVKITLRVDTRTLSEKIESSRKLRSLIFLWPIGKVRICSMVQRPQGLVCSTKRAVTHVRTALLFSPSSLACSDFVSFHKPRFVPHPPTVSYDASSSVPQYRWRLPWQIWNKLWRRIDHVSTFPTIGRY
jgi:hypothetical protein